MGGRIAAEIALRNPDFTRSLVLVNSAGFGPMPHVRLATPFARLSVARQLPAPLPSWLIRIPVSAVYGSPDNVTDRDVEEYRAPSQHREFLIAMVQLLRNFDWRELNEEVAGRIRKCSHLLVGELDRVVMTCRSGGAARRTSAGWRVTTVSGIAHVVHEEAPGEILAVVDEILRG
jgi:pimeloyl-ACP methyl ester carboxylesterase